MYFTDHHITEDGTESLLFGQVFFVFTFSYGGCSSLVRHEAHCYIAREAGRDERRLSLDLMPNRSPKGR
jgi:hypothetical protein